MITLSLPIPPSINVTSRAGVNRKTGMVYKPGAKLKNQYKEDVLWAARAAGVAGKGLEGAIVLKVCWFFPGKRGALDWDGGIKTLQDALAEAIGFNDSRIVECHSYKTIEKGTKPRVEITLSEMEYEEVAR